MGLVRYVPKTLKCAVLKLHVMYGELVIYTCFTWTGNLGEHENVVEMTRYCHSVRINMNLIFKLSLKFIFRGLSA